MDDSKAYHIRLKIDQLKRELAALEGENLSPDERTDAATAFACGHDVVIDNLRSTARRFGQKGRAVLAAWQEGRGGSGPWWYSTTATPSLLPYDIRSVESLLRVFELFSERNTLELLRVLFENEGGLSVEELPLASSLELGVVSSILSRLCKHGYASDSGGSVSLTLKGWQFFIVVSHLVFVQELKLEPSKALKIIPAFQEVFGIQWGEYLGMSESDALKKLDEHGWLERLRAEGICEEDVRSAIYEHNCPR